MDNSIRLLYDKVEQLNIWNFNLLNDEESFNMMHQTINKLKDKPEELFSIFEHASL